MKCREVQKSICNIGKLKLRMGLHVLCFPSHGDMRGALHRFFQGDCPRNGLTTQQFE